MRPIALALALTLAATPAMAQQVPSTPELRLPEQLDRDLRRFMDKMKPLLDETFEAFENLPDIDSLEHYQMPEVLPNGDIIIRRRPDAPPYEAAPEKPEPGIKT